MTMTDQDFEQGEQLEEAIFRPTYEVKEHSRLAEVSRRLYARYYGTGDDTEIPFGD